MATKASKVSTTGTNGINYMGSQWETGESPRQNYDQKNIRMSKHICRAGIRGSCFRYTLRHKYYFILEVDRILIRVNIKI